MAQHHRSQSTYAKRLIDRSPVGRWVTGSLQVKAAIATVGIALISSTICGYVTAGIMQFTGIQSYYVAVVFSVAFVGLAVVPVVLMIASSWTRPIRDIAHRTELIAQGSTPVPLKVDREDEIGELARAFNRMSSTIEAARIELRRANAQLETKVYQRTEELHRVNEQLRVQMQDKDEFIRAITHDLNAPVRNIDGLTKMLLMKHAEEMEPEVLSKLERIAANARTEAELISDLLDLSRIRTQPGKRGAVDLNKLVDDIAQTLSYDTESKRITLVRDSLLPTVYADRNRLRQVFQNLIDNAIKYMPADAATREIHVGCRQDMTQQTVLYVADTGHGIDDKDRHRVFQVFQRARYSGQHDSTGRGVGLATVKSIVETYGGKLWVDSEPGEGAAFSFTLGKECYVADAKEPQPT